MIFKPYIRTGMLRKLLIYIYTPVKQHPHTNECQGLNQNVWCETENSDLVFQYICEYTSFVLSMWADQSRSDK